MSPDPQARLLSTHLQVTTRSGFISVARTAVAIMAGMADSAAMAAMQPVARITMTRSETLRWGRRVTWRLRASLRVDVATSLGGQNRAFCSATPCCRVLLYSCKYGLGRDCARGCWGQQPMKIATSLAGENRISVAARAHARARLRWIYYGSDCIQQHIYDRSRTDPRESKVTEKWREFALLLSFLLQASQPARDGAVNPQIARMARGRTAGQVRQPPK